MGVCASAPNDHGSAIRLDFSAVRTTKADAKGVDSAGLDAPRDDGEVFFDSRAWLDSDCEDYFSVCEEATPSRTPIHTSLLIEITTNFIPETPSTPKKLLIDLLRESNNSNPANSDQALNHTQTAPGHANSPTNSHDRTNNSVRSSEMTPNSKPLKQRSSQSSPCCLPNLVRNLSFNERRKKMSNGNIGVKS
ncbi:hypothetical protein MLD38_003339 [Melastoma candidum]|uniref:Uncharacterized protein n=1 Tax=Melastoma candidum TaxID=119954 RepID=A0ACB9S2X4_9MYRT|nr:hypothetical protein MLD38_003339 [Melastoma candidum]